MRRSSSSAESSRDWRRAAPSSAPRRRSRAPERERPGTRTRSGSPSRASRSISALAGVAEPEQPRALVERLAGGVVERRPEDPGARLRSLHGEAAVCDRRSPPGRGTAARPGRARGRARQRGRAGGRPARAAAAASHASALAGRDADQQRADQARPCGDARRARRRRGRASRLGERFRRTGGDQLEVMARRHLGHDAAVRRVQVGLRGDRRWRGSRPPSATTAGARCRRRTSRARESSARGARLRSLPHDQGVLAVVRVVRRAATPRGLEADACSYSRIAILVRHPYLERVSRADRRPAVTSNSRLEQLGSDVRARRYSGATARFIRMPRRRRSAR